jgi:hypothetical protein
MPNSRPATPNAIGRRSLLQGALTGSALGLQSRAAAAAPNILHIMTDQQQWATVAGRSPCRTPNLNRLADSGMRFERSYTPSAVCCPARAAILSGSYHWHNGVFTMWGYREGAEEARRCGRAGGPGGPAFLAGRPQTGNDPQPQLFRITEDPGEKNNLATMYPGRVKKMLARLEQIEKAGRSRP